MGNPRICISIVNEGHHFISIYPDVSLCLESSIKTKSEKPGIKIFHGLLGLFHATLKQIYQVLLE